MHFWCVSNPTTLHQNAIAQLCRPLSAKCMQNSSFSPALQNVTISSSIFSVGLDTEKAQMPGKGAVLASEDEALPNPYRYLAAQNDICCSRPQPSVTVSQPAISLI